ncbi:MAG: hypothetical protein D9N14_06505 [Ketobacter sp.]|nr:MAG: hypothetical protein D9N14_06505 [Ketobacter sp.]
MKYLFRIKLAVLSIVLALLSGCSVGVYDGLRVSNTASTINPWGYVTSAPTSASKMRVQARHPTTGSWVTIKNNVGISASVAWTTADGTKLYNWNAGNIVIPGVYWTAGTGGYFARIRTQWTTNGSSWINTLVSRKDAFECFTENFNGEGNTTSYMSSNCFSHRGEAYVYTSNYREGPASCPAPAAALAKTNGHYMVNQIPSCARTIVSNHMREKIDENNILLHYEINHNTSTAASKNALPNDASGTCSRQPGSDGTCELGGFFGGHERYIRRMERHVMVYDYPWMPEGKIPAWNGSTWIPTQFQNAEVSPNGSCNSWTCDGWRSDPITDSTPNALKPNSVLPGNVCAFASTAAVASASNSWHSSGHVNTGGHFGTFDSPANPLFFLWHNAINDVWVDYRNCP